MERPRIVMDKNLPRGQERINVLLWEMINSCLSYKSSPWKASEDWDNKWEDYLG